MMKSFWLGTSFYITGIAIMGIFSIEDVRWGYAIGFMLGLTGAYICAVVEMNRIDREIKNEQRKNE